MPGGLKGLQRGGWLRPIRRNIIRAIMKTVMSFRAGRGLMKQICFSWLYKSGFQSCSYSEQYANLDSFKAQEAMLFINGKHALSRINTCLKNWLWGLKAGKS